MLDGQGADEVLAGYHAFFAPYLASLVRDGRIGDAWREIQAFKQRHGYSESRAIRGIARALLSSDPQFASVSALSYAQADLQQPADDVALRRSQFDGALGRVTSAVSGSSAGRVRAGLPDAFKIGGGVTKRVLRGAMSGVLPDRIRDRVDKIGFETPESLWITGARRQWFRSQFAQAVEAAIAWFRPRVLGPTSTRWPPARGRSIANRGALFRSGNGCKRSRSPHRLEPN